MCITTNKPGNKSNPNPNPNPKPTTKQHAIVNIQSNIKSRVLYVSREIHTRQCCTVFTGPTSYGMGPSFPSCFGVIRPVFYKHRDIITISQLQQLSSYTLKRTQNVCSSILNMNRVNIRQLYVCELPDVESAFYRVRLLLWAVCYTTSQTPRRCRVFIHFR